MNVYVYICIYIYRLVTKDTNSNVKSKSKK